MDYAEFKRHIGKAGLTINEFSALIDVQASSISNYANKVLIPTKYAVLAVLLGEAAEQKMNFREALSRNGINWSVGRGDKKIARIADYRSRPKR